MLRRFKHLQKPISEFADCELIYGGVSIPPDDCTQIDNAIQLNDVRIQCI